MRRGAVKPFDDGQIFNYNIAITEKTMPDSKSGCIALLAFCCAGLSLAQTPLTTINNPNGGVIVYGKVDGASSEASAMGIILHSLHSQYGDRPQTGHVFRVRGTNSVAVYFTLTKRTQRNAVVAGLLIAMRAPDHVEAALLSDDAARFGTTVNPMLRTLFSRWHPGGASGTAAGPGAPRASGAVAPLHRYTAPDQSVSFLCPMASTSRLAAEAR